MECCSDSFCPVADRGRDGAALRHPLLRFFRRAVPHVVVDAAPAGPEKAGAGGATGENGRHLPSGPRTATGSLMKIYDSAALIAAHCGARIVPVHVAGTLYTRFRGGRGPVSEPPASRR